MADHGLNYGGMHAVGLLPNDLERTVGAGGYNRVLRIALTCGECGDGAGIFDYFTWFWIL